MWFSKYLHLKTVWRLSKYKTLIHTKFSDQAFTFLTIFVPKWSFNLENLITIKEVSKGLTWFHQHRRWYIQASIGIPGPWICGFCSFDQTEKHSLNVVIFNQLETEHISTRSTNTIQIGLKMLINEDSGRLQPNACLRAKSICCRSPLDAVLSSGLCGKAPCDRLNRSENYLLL